MSKFINVVKVKVKEVYKEEYLKKTKEMKRFKGLISSKTIEIGPNAYCFIGEWDSQTSYKAAYPQMIEHLNTIRSLLEEISNELGVTDPSSGPIIIEQ